MSILDDARPGMNHDIRPQDDLFGHVNGRWLDETEIPSDRSSWGPFVQLADVAEQGRLLVVGFAAGQGIPEVKVNRLLLNNIDVRGVGWGAYAMTRQDFMQQQWAELVPMIESGVVKPPIGATYALEDFGQALVDMDERRTLGKSVVRLR